MNGRTPEEGRNALRDFLPGGMLAGLDPRETSKAWLLGLAMARVPGANLARVIRDGNEVRLSRLIEMDCPSSHPMPQGRRRGRTARVRLLVSTYTGWVAIHEDSCPACTVEEIEWWLVTCPRCLAGDDGHDIDHALGVLDDGDESPLAYVAEAMYQLGNHLHADDEEEQGDAQPSLVDKHTVRAWLDRLVAEDGSHLVPPAWGQTRAWEAVREVPGHPPQALVRAAQAMRKREA